METRIAKSLDELLSIAQCILTDKREDRIFALDAKMGAGKTTLIKFLCQALGVEENVSSPTFSLVNEYTDRDTNPVFHFDFYRIKKLEEVYDIGYEEYFYSGNYCFIEWPEKASFLIPDDALMVSIEVREDGSRELKFELPGG